MTAEQHQAIRAQALSAAATWLAGVDPFTAGRDYVLETASVFAAWIESGEQQ